MPFTLTYKVGTYLHSEVFGSLMGATARAFIEMYAGGCTDFQILSQGKIVRCETELEAGLLEAVGLACESGAPLFSKTDKNSN